MLKKAAIVQKAKTTEHTRTERQVLEHIRQSPFLVTLHYAFQTQSKLHLILGESRSISARWKDASLNLRALMFFCLFAGRECRLCERRRDVHSLVPARSLSRGGGADLYRRNNLSSGAPTQGGCAFSNISQFGFLSHHALGDIPGCLGVFFCSWGSFTETSSWKTSYWTATDTSFWQILGSVRSFWKRRYEGMVTSLKLLHESFVVMHFLGSFQKERTYSFCGTIEYMAPEIIRGKAGHGKVKIRNSAESADVCIL